MKTVTSAKIRDGREKEVSGEVGNASHKNSLSSSAQMRDPALPNHKHMETGNLLFTAKGCLGGSINEWGWGEKDS